MRSLTGTAIAGLLSFGLLAGSAYSAGPAKSFAGEFPVVSGTGTLTVNGGGYWSRDTYVAGEQPFLSGLDNDGLPLPDGSYRYEFREMAAESTQTSSRKRDVLKGHGSGRDYAKQKSTDTLSGRFDIQGGQVIFP
jgi:hypothetical protein